MIVNGNSLLTAGLDEVGRGCIAGPMLVVVLGFSEERAPVEGIRDSKQLDPVTRERLAPKILQASKFFGFGWAEPSEIDELGMTKAWQYACQMALARAPKFLKLCVDGQDSVDYYPGEQETVIHGDDLIWQIGAASIVAKVMRDNEMYYQAQFYPDYKWDRNAGYGTADHYALIQKNGITREHRKLFLRKFAKKTGLNLN
jgi:ribonuclease HII